MPVDLSATNIATNGGYSQAPVNKGEPWIETAKKVTAALALLGGVIFAVVAHLDGCDWNSAFCALPLTIAAGGFVYLLYKYVMERPGEEIYHPLPQIGRATMGIAIPPPPHGPHPVVKAEKTQVVAVKAPEVPPEVQAQPDQPLQPVVEPQSLAAIVLQVEDAVRTPEVPHQHLQPVLEPKPKRRFAIPRLKKTPEVSHEVQEEPHITWKPTYNNKKPSRASTFKGYKPSSRVPIESIRYF